MGGIADGWSMGGAPPSLCCLKCGWYLCGPCNKAAPCPKRPKRVPACQALILVPTRELAMQIHHWVTILGKGWVRCTELIGGTSVRGSIDAVQWGRHIVVGNPGRVFDLISKRHLRVESLKCFFIDEADAMLSASMKDQLYDIFKCIPPQVQVACVATRLQDDVFNIFSKFMRDAAYVTNQGDVAEPWIPTRVQHYCMVGGGEPARRLLGLRGMLIAAPSAMVFCNTRREVDAVVDQLQAEQCVAALHAELDMRERQLVMREFRKGTTRALVTTSEFARGLDLPRVRLVINLELPRSEEDYLLRAGRCGRFDRVGTVITFASPQDIKAAQALAQRYGLQLAASTMDAVTEALRRRGDLRPRSGVADDS